MGENIGDAEHLAEKPLFFTASCGGETLRYGPFTDLNEFFWEAGFVTGCLAGKGYRPSDIVIATYQGDQLIDLRAPGQVK